MSKLKDQALDDKLFADKEIEASEHTQGYHYFDDKKQHLHTLDGKPLLGTSTICGVIAKPLVWWASGMACGKFGWLDPKKNSPENVKTALSEGFERVRSLSIDEYKTLLAEAYKAHSVKLKDSATAGTDLHAEAEKFVKVCIETDDIVLAATTVIDQRIVPFVLWAQVNVKRFLWSEAHCYSREFWVGGITDCAAELNDGSYVIIDFKSSREAYQSQFVQIGGYAVQIEENGIFDSKGKLIQKFDKPFTQFIVFPFGSEKVEPAIRHNVEEFKEGFKCATRLYKLMENI